MHTQLRCWVRYPKELLVIFLRENIFSLIFFSDDTSNFDEFPDVDLKIPSASATVTQGSKDWVFINYTFKRFEGLTQRGPIPKL